MSTLGVLGTGDSLTDACKLLFFRPELAAQALVDSLKTLIAHPLLVHCLNVFQLSTGLLTELQQLLPRLLVL